MPVKTTTTTTKHVWCYQSLFNVVRQIQEALGRSRYDMQNDDFRWPINHRERKRERDRQRERQTEKLKNQ